MSSKPDRPMAKINRPETLAEAHKFTSRNNRHLAAGLCPRCAAQASYGHAHGFNQVQPPCPACAPVVALFPTSAPNGWRKVVGARLEGPLKPLQPGADAPVSVLGIPGHPDARGTSKRATARCAS